MEDACYQESKVLVCDPEDFCYDVFLDFVGCTSLIVNYRDPFCQDCEPLSEDSWSGWRNKVLVYHWG